MNGLHKMYTFTNNKHASILHILIKLYLCFQLYNYFEDNNYVYLILEMCHNGELQRYLKSNCKVLSEDEGEILTTVEKHCLLLHVVPC